MSVQPSDLGQKGRTAMLVWPQLRTIDRTQISDPSPLVIRLGMRSPANAQQAERGQIV